MLTADLLRARVRSGGLHPMFIDPEDEALLRRARGLVREFKAHDQKTRAEMDEALNDLVGDDVTFAITRGLSKLLHDRSTWEPSSPVPPVELRRLIFETSAANHPVGEFKSREQVLEEVAAELGVSAEQVELGMYSDLKAEHRLTSFKELDPSALLHRYNLALAQGMLYRASTMSIEVKTKSPAGLRQLFRWLKFYQLMHRALRSKTGWRIEIDGPLSLFDQSQRYGLQMAKFLPALLLTENWRMEASVQWRDRPDTLKFELTPSVGLVSHLKSTGMAVSREEKLVVERLKKKKDWSVSKRATVLDLGGKDVLVPDFTLSHKDGRKAYVEVVGFWRRSYLERRIEVLSKYGPKNLVLCVSRRMATEKTKADLGAVGDNVIDFAEVISVPRLLKVVERVAL